MKKIRIIIQFVGAYGLTLDADVLKTALHDMEVAIEIYDLVQYDSSRKALEYDANIFIESINGINEKLFPAKKNYFIPNQDVLDMKVTELLHLVNTIICRTKLVDKVFSQLKKDKGFTYDLYYTGFTSIPNFDVATTPKNINKNIITHFAGLSALKNMSTVLTTWEQNNGFLEKNPNLFLLLTRKLFQIDEGRVWSTPTEIKWVEKLKTGKKLSPEECGKLINIPLDNAVLYSKNIIYAEYINPKHMCDIDATYALCPSLMEGYGHYINTSRANGRIIITTNAEPMNELVTEDFGILMEGKQGNIKDIITEIGESMTEALPLSYTHTVNAEQLKLGIEKALSLSDKDIDLMKKRCREAFIRDHEFFSKSINKLLN